MEVPSHVVSRSSGAVARAAENQAGGDVMTRSVSDLLSYPQLSRVCGMLGSRSRWGGVAWAFWWKPAPSAAPRARWGHLAGWVQVAFTRWSRVTARGSRRAGVACPSMTITGAKATAELIAEAQS